MGCIPIATRHPTFVELERRGVPLFLVEAWEFIDDAMLVEAYESLFPKVQEFRQHLLDLDEWWSFSFPCHQHAGATFAL